MQFDNIREKFGRFRILVIGRANAGKTTILKQICNSTEDPEIYDEEGRKIVCDHPVDPIQFWSGDSSPERGEHSIGNGMVFRSNPDFIFHDSRGFEAGSVDEFNLMKDFVTERAKTEDLKKRLHAIWYCIPMDQMHRAILTAEEKFFDECERGNVPVVVVFTKCDAFIIYGAAALTAEEKRLPREEMLVKIYQYAERVQKEKIVHIWEWLQRMKYPPKVYAELKDMHKSNEGCKILLERTTEALNDVALEMLFETTSRTNITTCINFALDRFLIPLISKQSRLVGSFSNKDQEELIKGVASWFPHVKVRNMKMRAIN